MYGQANWASLFLIPFNLRRIVLCCAIQGSVQMTGVSAIQYYAPTIFAQIGLSAGNTLLYQAINSIIVLIAQDLCVLIVAYIGRRWTLIRANTGCECMFTFSCILLTPSPNTKYHNLGHTRLIQSFHIYLEFYLQYLCRSFTVGYT